MLPTRNRGFGFWECAVASFWRCFFGKIDDFSRMTSNRHKCVEKDIFTIVVAMSTESYFSLHFCWRIIIGTQFFPFRNLPWAIFPVFNRLRDLPNFNCSREIKMTIICYYPWPLFTVVKIPAKLEFTFDSRQRRMTFVQNELDSAVFNGSFVTIILLLWKRRQGIIP